MARAAAARADIQQALLLRRQGRLDEAERICASILAAIPGETNALHLLGLLRSQQGRNAEAPRLIGAALRAAPGSADVLNNYGFVLAALRRHEEALAYFEQALHRNAGHVNALVNRADALARLKRDAEALAAYDDVRAREPDHLHALNESGALCMRLGRPAAALATNARAAALAPGAPELHINKGTALRALARYDEALASFAAAAALDPVRAEAHYNAALVRLCRGDFKAGWADYEWRWRKPDWADQRRAFAAPQWRGDAPLAGKTILLHAEQGLGDSLQFIRYVPLVARRGGRVILEVQPPLKRLVTGIEGAAQVIARGEALSAFDLHCPLLSLPLAFATELSTIPADIPYLRPAREAMAEWSTRLPDDGRLRVGLCWAGSPQHRNDHNRSIALERFAGILSLPGIAVVSLQKQTSEAEAAFARDRGAIMLGQDLADFADTAAVVAMLDLVIAVDTSVAHLAGAMGKAVALLLPFSPDWRWLIERTDSPWYPTMRLYRQSAPGAWEAPLERLRAELAAVAIARAGRARGEIAPATTSG